jgi:(E)-4-hydroxy-3-methylbut-2-enyl-diphosphate synthase
VDNIGGHHVPVVIADMSKISQMTRNDLKAIGYSYEESLDKWNIMDAAADYIFTGNQVLDFALPGTLKVICYPATWAAAVSTAPALAEQYFPIFDAVAYTGDIKKSSRINFVMKDCFSDETPINDFSFIDEISKDATAVLCLSSENQHSMQSVRRMFIELQNRNIRNPVVIICDSNWQTADEHLIHYSTECGALFLDGFGDGICLGMSASAYQKAAQSNSTGRTYLLNNTPEQFINNTAFSILQATRTRISKTEYISCPSCGRTLFDLQETTAKIRARTNHLKGVKIAIMGCIVNGPGEMADADFGYVGSGVGKITLYRGKEVVKRNIDSEIAVDELINLLRENDAWVEPAINN